MMFKVFVYRILTEYIAIKQYFLKKEKNFEKWKKNIVMLLKKSYSALKKKYCFYMAIYTEPQLIHFFFELFQISNAKILWQFDSTTHPHDTTIAFLRLFRSNFFLQLNKVMLMLWNDHIYNYISNIQCNKMKLFSFVVIVTFAYAPPQWAKD